MLVYSRLVAACLVHAFNLVFHRESGAIADQHQSNGTWGIHQFRVRRVGDPTIYRVIVAPEDAPIFVGSAPNGLAIDKHFIEPLLEGVADQLLKGAPDRLP